MTSDALRSKLQKGLTEISLELSSDQIDQLLKYLDLMNRWNKKINLTAITDPSEQITKHLLDSFSIYSLIEERNPTAILDVGSGAGLPGIPLAIAQPDRQWHLLDNSTKRISFLRVVITQLNLQNVELINSRVEEHQSDQLYPIIVCRAFASLKEITHNANHLLTPNGSILAMKGQYPEQEIADMPDPFAVTESHVLSVPGLMEERHLLEIQRK
jgi:16S rRNA (guanine527-N7)-methyltransferase